MCYFISVRWYSVIVLLFFAGLLPMAGTQQRFCVASHQFLLNGQACTGCIPSSDCCCADPTVDPVSSPCITVAKVLPDGVQPDPAIFTVSPLVVAMLPLSQTFPVAHVIETKKQAIQDRAPPNSVSLFLLQRRLLI